MEFEVRQDRKKQTTVSVSNRVRKLREISYSLYHKYQQIIEKIRMCAPRGLTEKRGSSRLKGGEDFRLNLGRYRVIGVAPMATRIAVFAKWRKFLKNRKLYEDDPDLAAFEDAFGYLGINENLNQPWNVYPDTDLDDGYVEVFLETGMRLIIKELKRTHSSIRAINCREEKIKWQN